MNIQHKGFAPYATSYFDTKLNQKSFGFVTILSKLILNGNVQIIPIKKCIKNYFRYVKTILISFQLLAIYDMKNSWKEILLKKSMIFMAILALLENPY